MPANHSKRSVRRFLSSANRGMKRYQEETGETVLWYEYDPVHSTKHAIYDEGPSRKWYRGKLVPVLFFYFSEAPEIASEEGRYTVNTANFTTSVELLTKAGISNPQVTDQHFSDRFSYGNTLYSIDNYQKQGFVHGQYLTVAVTGLQVKDEELFMDVNPWFEQFAQTPTV